MLDTVQFSSSIEEREEEEGTFVLHVLPSPVSLTSNQLKNFIGLLPLSQHIFCSLLCFSQPSHETTLFYSSSLSFCILSVGVSLQSPPFLRRPLFFPFALSIAVLHYLYLPFPLWLFPFSFTPPVLCSYVALKTWTGRRRTSEKTENLMHL